ncbi:MAG TPA: recombinase, partial [Ruminococcaceae bacterium]|nr:recombinase [Oscillospiraceae bacterium]
MQKKRVYALYRVSTLKQVDKDKDDIPMQKQACQEFIAAHPDWELYGEISEKGVSGFKVSAKDRDAIQEI